MRNREGASTISKFEGTVKEGVLAGTMKSERGETKIEGKRAPRMSRAVGSWEMKIKVGEREFTGTLTITADKEGTLAGIWKSQRGEREVTDLKYERGALSYTRTIKTQDNEWTSTFEGNIRGNAISGKLKSDRGEAEVTGERLNADIIGTWNLELISEQGSRKQRLRINPDMSALYGSTLVKKVDVKDGKISFKIVLEFGDRKFETNIEGTIAENKLTGESKTSRGTRKITGTKVVRRFGGRRPTTNQNR
jgi:Tfp pilus assembly major pilin PilA